MLAGIIISVVVLACLAVAVPWLVAHRDTPDAVDGDPSERFSDSMRIVRRDVEDYADAVEGAEISTPLIRRAELTELRLQARAAASRRARTASILTGLTLVFVILGFTNVLPWWTVAFPGALLLAFMIASPILVRAMNKRFDARAAKVMEGYQEDEITETFSVEGIIDETAEDEESSTIDVDLSAPDQSGSLWESIPVTAPTYVSKPLAARTVRTIDLSSPVAPTAAIVPTADKPEDDVESLDFEETEVVERPRAIGE